ncbi:unannotated protein [freshwater metagenome]|uniref:Unannotated protein n=1 Tax=freshwater metagenome TaxID=449393 RepID=A0A6J6DVG2_9ZZZZ
MRIGVAIDRETKLDTRSNYRVERIFKLSFKFVRQLAAASSKELDAVIGPWIM